VPQADCQFALGILEIFGLVVPCKVCC